MDAHFNTTQPLAVFNGKGFRYPFWFSILVITQMGLSAMFVAMMAGAPVFLSMLAMVAAFIIGIGWLAGNVTYTLYHQGIYVEITPFQWLTLARGTQVRHYNWSEIKSYRTGTDMNRALATYHYLYIRVSKMPYQLRLSDDKNDKASFHHFLEKFEQQIAMDGNAILPKQGHSRTTQKSIFSNPTSVKRKPSFYERPIAHLVFWILAIGSGGLAWVMLSQGMLKDTYLMRFGLIIVPGLCYMAYRLYAKK